MKAKALNAVADQIAGCLLFDAEGALPLIEKSGGLPHNLTFAGDAEMVFRCVESLKRDGVPLSALAVRDGCGLDAKRVDQLADAAPLLGDVPRLVARLQEHALIEKAVSQLRRDDADLGYRLAEVNACLAPLAGGGREAATIDAAAWLAEPDEAEQPIVCGLFDHGDRVSIVGQSKAKKSFYALQLAVAIACGQPMCEVETVRRRVLVVNGEIRPGPYRRRLRRMLAALRITADALADSLLILNTCEGRERVTWESILAAAKKAGAEVAILDPAYLLLGDEIDQSTAKENVASMRGFAAAGITLVSVFHASKGMIGDRQVIDRVAGSGVYARDASTIIALCEHASEPDTIVQTAIARNHPPSEPQSLVFRDGAFFETDVAPVEKTSRTRAQRTFTPDQIKGCFTVDGDTYTPTVNRIRERLAVGTNRAKELLASAVKGSLCDVRNEGRSPTYHAKEVY